MKPFKALITVITIIYFLALLKFVLFKRSPASIKEHFQKQYSWNLVKKNAKRGNYIPFHTIQFYLSGKQRAEFSQQNLLGNIILFIPLGILLPALFISLRYFGKILLVSVLVSLALELLQLITVLGSFDVDDLLLNTFGGVLGYPIFRLWYRNRELRLPA